MARSKTGKTGQRKGKIIAGVGTQVGTGAFDESAAAAAAANAGSTTNTEMLPEQTEAGREIVQAQEGLETATTTSTETTEVELKEKPAMLSKDAELARRKSLEEAFKASKNLGHRMAFAIGHPAIMAGFPNRPADSVAVEELVAFRDARLADLPETGNYHKFSYEANGLVQKLFERTQKIVQAFFQGRYDVQLAEVKEKVVEIEKPAPFSMEAELVRQEDLTNAQKISENELRRYGVAVGYRSIMEAFEKDADGSVTPERYRGFRDSRLSKFPTDANYFKFAKDANDLVREQKPNLQKELQQAFAGCYDVSLVEVQDELLLIEAEAGMRNDRRRGLKIDETMTVAVCATDHDKPVRFAAMVWFDRGGETGHAFVTNSNEVKAACVECREVGVMGGVQFYPFAVAERKAKATKSAGATFADALKTTSGGGNGQRRGVSDEEKRKASSDVNKFLQGVPGPYYFKHPSWEIKGAEGYVGGKGAKVYILSDGENAKVLDREKDFGRMVGEEFPLSDIPGRLWAFLSQYRNLNRPTD